jgi:hypothetical protein
MVVVFKTCQKKKKARIPIVLLQILNRTLRNQASNGSWSRSRGVSAYSVLTLVNLYSLPWISFMKAELDVAIMLGRKFINESPLGQPDNICVEKVSYGSKVLCQVYCLSALNAPVDNSPWDVNVTELVRAPLRQLKGYSHFLSKLPLFAEEPIWKIQLSLAEGCLFLPLLQQMSGDIFPRPPGAEEKYLGYIPLTWTSTNNLCGSSLSPGFLEEMMIISMLIYQADEFMEAVVGKDFEFKLEPIKEIVRSLCNQLPSHQTSAQRGGMINASDGTITSENQKLESDWDPSIIPPTSESVRAVLQRFTSYVLDHPKIVASSVDDQLSLRRELQNFLLAHITHIEDNSRFSRQEVQGAAGSFLSPRNTYYDWVHTTGADNTSCPYSFAFISCLTSTGASDCFATLLSKYLAQDLCLHLAVMCRQYNDCGSILRDRIERNLNSTNFPEFHPGKYSESDAELKRLLLEVAEFERQCLTSSMETLTQNVPFQVAEMLKVFVNVTDLYGQIYVARDIGITSRIV